MLARREAEGPVHPGLRMLAQEGVPWGEFGVPKVPDLATVSKFTRVL